MRPSDVASGVIGGDVAADHGYLAIHETTRSEIVVVDDAAGVPVGLIDVESEPPDAFAEPDQRLLKRCEALISPLWRAEPDGDVPRRGRVSREIAG